MTKNRFVKIRGYCLVACVAQPEVRAALGLKHIAITGGTGFLGTWLAETFSLAKADDKL